mmetsp:Transcript_21088/g.56193  ORF Transcript_21088/g.56193 Transcript_21088/m.56193 type:complete len:219 (+) Transcript_21088:1098-1754(+)
MRSCAIGRIHLQLWADRIDRHSPDCALVRAGRVMGAPMPHGEVSGKGTHLRVLSEGHRQDRAPLAKDTAVSSAHSQRSAVRAHCPTTLGADRRISKRLEVWPRIVAIALRTVDTTFVLVEQLSPGRVPQHLGALASVFLAFRRALAPSLVQAVLHQATTYVPLLGTGVGVLSRVESCATEGVSKGVHTQIDVLVHPGSGCQSQHQQLRCDHGIDRTAA